MSVTVMQWLFGAGWASLAAYIFYRVLVRPELRYRARRRKQEADRKAQAELRRVEAQAAKETERRRWEIQFDAAMQAHLQQRAAAAQYQKIHGPWHIKRSAIAGVSESSVG